MPRYDTIIRDTKVINGTGAPWYRCDVAIKNGKIAAIGQLHAETADKEIFGNGHYLSPGFIDTHTHDDIEVIKNPQHLAKLLQGVTTIVTGNCSFSNYPTKSSQWINTNKFLDIDTHELTRQHIDAELGTDRQLTPILVKDHISSLLGDIQSHEMFEDFQSYREKLTASGISLNVISLVGHGPIRISIMGFERRKASNDEIAGMCDLFENQMKQGAAGLSFGLVYPPSAFADENELIALAKIVKKYDGVLAAHIRCYGGEILKSINEFIRILKQSGAKGLLSHLQVAGKPYWGMMGQALDLVEKARCNDIDISVDMYPYKAGSTSILQILPPSSLDGGVEKLLKKLENPHFREELRTMVESGKEEAFESKISLIGWNNITISSVTSKKFKFAEGMTIPDAAAKLSMSPFDFTIEAIKADAGTTCIIMFQQSDEDQITVHKSRLQMIGSDGIPRQGGKPHPRHYGTFPRVIGQLAIKDGLMPLEEAIRRCTSLPAQRFNLYDRGILLPGMTADLVLFNGNLFCDRSTYTEPRLHPDGLIGLWVNGVQVVDNGKFCSLFPGRVIVNK